MSKTMLNLLSIQGIRSFDNQRGETIQFYSPLTLINGLNGSGKTTIIESLKYITTGQTPPNSKGGAFIHDPKLCGEKEVLAVAKMSFFNTQGQKMVCSRRQQLTVKKNTRQTKTLEGALVLHANGERTAISSRVAELDQMMPMYIGVSKSVLDNVIFCHQDESLWPMSEPASLKTRFDEIFEAMKYTKAIAKIKALRQRYSKQLEDLKKDEMYAKQEKIKGEKVEKRMNQLYTEIEGLSHQIDELQQQANEAQRNHEHAADMAGGFGDIVSTLNGKRVEANTMERNVYELRQHMEMMQDSDEELRSMHDSYGERVESFLQELEEEKRKYHDLTSRIDHGRQQIGQGQSELGKLQAEKDHFDSQLDNREQSVKIAARRHGIRGFDHELDDEHIKAFMDRIAKMAKDQRSAIERAQNETRSETQQVQTVLNSLNERKVVLNQNKENSKSMLQQNDRRIADLRRRIDAVNVDEGRQAVLQSSVREIEANLDESKDAINNGRWETQIPEAEARIQSGEQIVQRLQTDLVQATKYANETARLDFLKKQLKDTTQRLDANKGANVGLFNKLFGSSWQPSDLSKRYDEALRGRASQLKEAETQRDGTSSELQQVGFELKTARDLLKGKRKEFDEKKKRLREVTDDPSHFHEVLEELEKELETLSLDRSNFGAKKEYYLGVQKVLAEKNVCQLCARTFRTEDEKSSIKKKLKRNLEEAENNLNEQNIATVEAELAGMKAAKSAHDRWATLQESEIPEAQKEIDRLEPRHEELLKKVEREDGVVSERKTAKDDVESLSKTVQTISRQCDDIAQFDAEIQSLSQKQSQAGFTGSVDDLEAQMEQENQQLRSARATFNNLKNKRDSARANVNALEIELRDARSDLNFVTQQLKDKADIHQQLEETSRMSEEHRSNLRKFDGDLSKLAPDISQTQVKLDDVGRRGAERETQLQDELTNFSSTLNALELAERDIKAYIDRDGPGQLERCEEQLTRKRSDLSRLEADQRDLTGRINMLKEQGDEHDKTKRHIMENLRYRENLRSLNEVKASILELESQNAESDREKWQSEVKKWQIKRNKLASEEAELWGRKKTTDHELVRLQDEFQTEYEGAPYRYREAHVKVEANKAAVEDLGRYGGALDKAIMRYHSLKMDEINEIIDDLWRRTYQGTDVDTILIRSESDGLTKAAEKKNYNYRVCMIKQDAEMDMRGRCSAGQKVLASIIIRLALAECFAANCGVMALDEPTTNLDRDNIRALAQSLHGIIEARASRNFQLIVITHDEQFMRDMRAGDFADYFYRVSRDERQKSKIDQESIHEVL